MDRRGVDAATAELAERQRVRCLDGMRSWIRGNLDWSRGIPHREGAYTFTHSGTTRRRYSITPSMYGGMSGTGVGGA